MSIKKVIFSLLALTLLYGCGGSDEKTVSTDSIITNTKPIADTGGNQNVEMGAIVILNGEQSIDNEGDTLTYQWSLLRMPEGSDIELSDVTSESVSFSPDIPGVYEAQLIVSDGLLSSEPSIVNITVIKANEAPTAIAGEDIQTYISMTVFLDGGASFDPEESMLIYNWSISSAPEDSSAVINNPDIKKPQFRSSDEGNYIIQLTVTDDEGASSQDYIMISVDKLAQKDVTLLRQELSDNKAKWQSKHIEHYQMDQFISCFCGEDVTFPVTMQVKEKDKSLFYYSAISQIVASAIDRNMMIFNSEESSFRTIMQLFDYIETAISGADEVTVSYHPELGYPQNFYIDWISLRTDDEIRFVVDNFIDLDDVNCEKIDKSYPNIIMNVIDGFTTEPINCDVLVEWQDESEELQQLVNDEFVPVRAFGIIGTPIRCSDDSSFLLTTQTGMVSLKIAKEGYLTKIVEYDILKEESCGLIPMEVEVKLEPIN